MKEKIKRLLNVKTYAIFITIIFLVMIVSTIVYPTIERSIMEKGANKVLHNIVNNIKTTDKAFYMRVGDDYLGCNIIVPDGS